MCATAVEEAFMKHMSWPANLSRPYVIESSSMLRRRFEPIASVGFTLSAPGFYAPQGRWLTLEPEIADFIPRLESFEYNGRRITNIEMESSSIGMLSALMGHQAITVCLIIASTSCATIRCGLHRCHGYDGGFRMGFLARLGVSPPFTSLFRAG